MVVGGSKKTKEKAFREITNKLVSKPIKLKPAWKYSCRANCKENGNSRRVGPDRSKEDLGPRPQLHLDSCLGPFQFLFNSFRPP